MQSSSPLLIGLWWLTVVLQTVVAMGMFRRRLIRELPVFFTYTIFHIVQFLVAMIVYRTSYSAYFYTYWAGEVLDAILTLLVIQEIFANLFRPYDSLRSLSGQVFRWTVLALAGVSVALAIGTSTMNRSEVVVALLVVQRSAMFVEAGTLMTLFLFSRVFGLTWRNYVFGISLGLGVSASISGIASAVRAHMGYTPTDWYSLVLTGASNCALIIWLYYILAPSSSFVFDRTQVDMSPLHEWNRALEELAKR